MQYVSVLTLLIWQQEEHAASKKYRFNNIKNFFLSEETKTQTDFDHVCKTW